MSPTNTPPGKKPVVNPIANAEAETADKAVLLDMQLELQRQLEEVTIALKHVEESEAEEKKHSKIKADFEKYIHEAAEIAASLDEQKLIAPEGETDPSELPTEQVSLLFCGGCAGEWAARTDYIGRLPGFGGILLQACGVRIVIDPGRSTFKYLNKLDISSNKIDHLFITHNHFDAVRDAKPLILSAVKQSIDAKTGKRTEINNRMHIYAHPSVLFGVNYARANITETLLKFLEQINKKGYESIQNILKSITKNLEKEINSRTSSFIKQLAWKEYTAFPFPDLPEAKADGVALQNYQIIRKFVLQNIFAPGIFSLYDIFINIGGSRFLHEIDIDVSKEYKLTRINLPLNAQDSGPEAPQPPETKIEVILAPSFHRVGQDANSTIPALFFMVQTSPQHHCSILYLNDTQYRENLKTYYETLQKEADLQRPIDVIILNVKTLAVMPQEDSRHTKNQLGWQGAIDFITDLKDLKLADTHSTMIVLRAWGIETVTRLREKDAQGTAAAPALIADTAKLKTYRDMFKHETRMENVLVPGVTWLHTNPDRTASSGEKFFTEHIFAPYWEQKQTFYELFYKSQLMHEMILDIKKRISQRKTRLILYGEEGVGTGVLARSIHQHLHSFGLANSAPVWKSAEDFNKNSDAWLASTLEEAATSTLIIDDFEDIESSKQLLLMNKLVGDKATQTRLRSIILISKFASPRAMQNQKDSRFDILERFYKVVIPPLRERREDIRILIQGWRMSDQDDVLKDLPEMSERVYEELETSSYTWPQNIKELKLLMEEIVRKKITSDKSILEVIARFTRSSSSHDTGSSRIKLSEDKFKDDVDRVLVELIVAVPGITTTQIKSYLRHHSGGDYRDYMWANRIPKMAGTRRGKNFFKQGEKSGRGYAYHFNDDDYRIDRDWQRKIKKLGYHDKLKKLSGT